MLVLLTRAMREPLKAGRVTSTDSHAFSFNQQPESGESIGHDGLIMKQNKNEELQSRRQFFKKAAKATLPILGAIVATNLPFVSRAANATPAGYCPSCSNDCMTECLYHCVSNCYSTCLNTCTGSCNGTCVLTCKNYCTSMNYA